MQIQNLTLLTNQYNYGQRLQSYALNIYIKKYLNLSVNLIDYWRSTKYNFRDFQKFEDQCLKLSGLSKISSSDIILYGGDQIFNFQWKHYLNIFDGSKFAKNKKISYAASDGDFICNYKDKYFDQNIKNIGNFNYISLREQKSCESLRNRFKTFRVNNQHITYNIDPVFLLKRDEWLNIVLQPKDFEQKFIFRYTNSDRSFLKYIKENSIIYACALNSDRVLNKAMPDPREWLWYLVNSEKVITTSFHGFAFSIIFNKKIECNYSNNYRIKELVNLLNIKIENEIIVNYDEVMQNIENERQRSFSYLKENLCNG